MFGHSRTVELHSTQSDKTWLGRGSPSPRWPIRAPTPKKLAATAHAQPARLLLLCLAQTPNQKASQTAEATGAHDDPDNPQLGKGQALLKSLCFPKPQKRLGHEGA